MSINCYERYLEISAVRSPERITIMILYNISSLTRY